MFIPCCSDELEAEAGAGCQGGRGSSRERAGRYKQAMGEQVVDLFLPRWMVDFKTMNQNQVYGCEETSVRLVKPSEKKLGGKEVCFVGRVGHGADCDAARESNHDENRDSVCVLPWSAHRRVLCTTRGAAMCKWREPKREGG